MWFIAGVLFLYVVNVAIGFLSGRWYLVRFSCQKSAAAPEIDPGSHADMSGQQGEEPLAEEETADSSDPPAVAAAEVPDTDSAVGSYLRNLREAAERLTRIRDEGLRTILQDIASQTVGESQQVFDLLTKYLDDAESVRGNRQRLKVDADEVYQQLSQLESTSNNLETVTSTNEVDDEEGLITLLLAEIERLQRAMSGWEESGTVS